MLYQWFTDLPTLENHHLICCFIWNCSNSFNQLVIHIWYGVWACPSETVSENFLFTIIYTHLIGNNNVLDIITYFIICMCSGETGHNKERVLQGQLDIPLSINGVNQAKLLGKKLNGAIFKEVNTCTNTFSYNSIRCRQLPRFGLVIWKEPGKQQTMPSTKIPVLVTIHCSPSLFL